MTIVRTICAAKMRGAPPMEGPIELSVVATFLWPKSISPKKRTLPGAEWKTTKPDEDNLKKLVQDSLNKIAYVDDAQVCSGHCWKKYGETASLMVRIRSLA